MKNTEHEEHDLMDMALRYFGDLSREKRRQETGLEEAETVLEQADVRLEVKDAVRSQNVGSAPGLLGVEYHRHKLLRWR